MGLGSTAKKVQLIAEKAESTYDQLMQLRDRMIRLEDTLEETGDRVDTLERENEAQRLLLEALADEQDIDVDAVLADAAITDAESDEESAQTDESTGTEPQN
jgi:septal ring factor EnvC (AmiA/AmiB activator)